MGAFTFVSSFQLLFLVVTSNVVTAQSSTSTTNVLVSAILQGLGFDNANAAATSTLGLSLEGKLASQLPKYNYTNSTTSASTTFLAVYSSSSSSSSTSVPTPASTASLDVYNSTVPSTAPTEAPSTLSGTLTPNGTATSTSELVTTSPLNSSATLNSSASVITDTANQKTVLASAIWTVPSTGTGLPYASECNREWQSYINMTGGLNAGDYSYQTSSYYVTNFSAPVTTLCAGNTQVIDAPVATASFLRPWTTDNVVYSATLTMPPTPSCTVPTAECSAIGFTSAGIYNAPEGCDPSPSTTCGGPCTIKGSDVQVLYFSIPSTANATKDVCMASPTPGPANQACPYGAFVTSTNTVTTTFTGVSSTGASTGVYGTATDTAVLDGSQLYTSVFTETLSECVYTSAAAGYQNRTAPYIMSGGNKYYEDMVYLSFKSVWAVNSCGSTVGTPRTGSLIAMSSSEVYSVCTQQAGSAAFAYNFQDLSGYVPASAWNCQPYCESIWNSYAAGTGGPSQQLVGNTPEDLGAILPPSPGDFYVNDQLVFENEGGYCGPFPYQSWYKPYVAVPPQVRALDPAWESCVLAFEGWYDPPTVLTQEASVVLPTAPTAAAASTPSPVPAQTTTTGSATSLAQPSSSITAIAQSTTSTPTVASSGPPSSDAIASSEVAISSSSARTTTSADSIVSATTSKAGIVASSVASLPILASSSPTANSVPQASSADPSAATQTSSVAQVAASNILSALTAEKSSTAADSTSTLASLKSSVAQISSLPAASSLANDPGTVASSQLYTTVAVGGTSVIVSQDPASSNAVVDGTTVVQGAQTTIQGQTVSVGSQGVQIGSTHVSVTQAQATVQSETVSQALTTQVTLGSSAFTIAAAATSQSVSAVVVAAGRSTATLAAGQTSVVGGQVVSVPSSGGVVVGQGSSATTIALVSSRGPTVISNGQAPPQQTTTGVSAATQAAVTGNTGQSLTIIQQGQSYSVADKDSTIVLAAGASTTFNGQTISLLSTTGAVQINGSPVTLVPASTPLGTVVTQAVFASNNGAQPITVVQQGSSYAVAVGTSTAHLAAGSVIVVAGATISAPPASGSVVLINGQSAVLSTVNALSSPLGVGAVITGSTGQVATVLRQGSSYLVQAGTTNIAIAAGSATVVNGLSLSVPTSGNAPVVNGQTIIVSTLSSPSIFGAIVTGTMGQVATVLQQGSSYLVQAGLTTISIAAGSATVVNGLSLSVPTSGSPPVVNGQTITISTLSSATIATIQTVETGARYTVLQQGSSFVVQAESSSTTVSAGAQVEVGGQTVSIPSSIASNGYSSAFSPPSQSQAVATQATLDGANSQLFTVVKQGSSYLVQDGSSTAVLATGGLVPFDGATVSMAASGNAVVANGQTVSLSAVTAPQTRSMMGLPTISPTSRASGQTGSASSSSSSEASSAGKHVMLSAPGSALVVLTLSIFVLLI
ncbi:hypothetical protein LTR62_002835 [Meristemomyces frigidus]|uniref:Uncharacterized protein n=1 Tax=Meristemomyces frigidus TaxID=1508187 RepID=A0AAN7TI81_9PEZI|nr:hypothetical protein LTR62_002835 [Meristemomyces frigidus]